MHCQLRCWYALPAEVLDELRISLILSSWWRFSTASFMLLVLNVAWLYREERAMMPHWEQAAAEVLSARIDERDRAQARGGETPLGSHGVSSNSLSEDESAQEEAARRR